MSAQIKNGTILLAEPFMLDPNFKRSTVLVVEHNPEGSLGFIMNRRVNMRVDALAKEFPEFDAPVYFGGPVGTDTVHYLHRKGDLLEGSDEVMEGIFWGGNYEKLRFLIDQKLITPYDIRFFVGYSGWSDSQLQEELEGGSWVTARMDPNYLFKSDPEKLWSQVMENKGDTFSVIASMREEPSYN
ncbi:putative transcriptional regulator [Lewinella aquimaris]|uniref:Putative transcriptional regulator n=1 Tax=Neolewinella aquimaris TaxID=1835722 RepID=A0A840EAA4_9BACT|nr:YqgE/AlgH family protein [Neolewinella aquimaris]MBB4077936.1 putative transcriptional regulator [Neolewinella aquimaris]